MAKIKKKKIAIFHCGFIYSGGGERIVLEEAKGLRDRGYEVVVYAPTLDPKKCYPEFLYELGVKTFLPSFIDWLPGRLALRMLATSLLAPVLAVNFRDIDVFIGANQPSAWIAFCMAKVLKKPYIVYLNQPNRLVYPRPVDKEFGWYSTVKDYQLLFKLIQKVKPLIAFLDRISVTKAKALLVNGAYIGGVIENIYGKDIIDAPAGAYAQPESQLNMTPVSVYRGKIRVGDIEIEKPYLLITNRHDPQKRFDYALKAFKLILRRYQKAKLLIPGPFTEHTKKLTRLARRLKIEDKVFFLGQIPEADLQHLYRGAVVYLYTSPEEDFGLGPLEAGGWGVPTVAWRHGGPTVTVEDGVTGFLAEPYNINDFAAKMLILLKNQKLRAKMGGNAWLRTQKYFSWNNHLDKLEQSILHFV